MKNAILSLAALIVFMFCVDFGLMIALLRVAPSFSLATISLIDAVVLVFLSYPVLHFLVYRNLTRQVNKCEALGKFNEALLDTIPFGIDIVDGYGNLLFISNKIKRMVGSDIKGKKCWELYRDDKKQCVDCPLRKGIKIGETSSVETGGCFGGMSVEITHTGMIYNNQKAILETFQDISGRVRDAQLKEDYYNIVTHELRSPLGVVKEAVDLVASGEMGPLGDKQKRLIEMTAKNVDKL